MMLVTLCFALQDFLSKQGFTPKGDDPLGIQVLRVETP
jgi:hypothetical protein